MLLIMLHRWPNRNEANSTSSKYVAWLRKQGNNQETFKASDSSVVSQMIPRLRPQATYVEDTKSASWKQKCFWNFPKAFFFAFWKQCFFRNNVSSFATLTVTVYFILTFDLCFQVRCVLHWFQTVKPNFLLPYIIMDPLYSKDSSENKLKTKHYTLSLI